MSRSAILEVCEYVRCGWTAHLLLFLGGVVCALLLERLLVAWGTIGKARALVWWIDREVEK